MHPGYFSLFQKTHHLKVCVKKETSVRTGPPHQLLPSSIWSRDQQCPWGACWECQILGLTSDRTRPNLHGKKIAGGPCAGEGLRSRGAALQALRFRVSLFLEGLFKEGYAASCSVGGKSRDQPKLDSWCYTLATILEGKASQFLPDFLYRLLLLIKVQKSRCNLTCKEPEKWKSDSSHTANSKASLSVHS